MRKLPHIFEQNRAWSERMVREDPGFFARLSSLQQPKYLWIGCSDSRVPANQITGLLPGEVFVHRNVGNVVWPTDLNCLAVLDYAINVLNVEQVIVCGHYGCGAVQAVMNDTRLGLTDYWLVAIKQVSEKYRAQLDELLTVDAKLDRLCELSVLEQASVVCKTDIVQDAWNAGRKLTVHGWVYRLTDGRLRDLDFCVSSPDELHLRTEERRGSGN